MKWNAFALLPTYAHTLSPVSQLAFEDPDGFEEFIQHLRKREDSFAVTGHGRSEAFERRVLRQDRRSTNKAVEVSAGRGVGVAERDGPNRLGQCWPLRHLGAHL